MKKDMFELRFESIGGMGANLAGKMFAQACVMYSNLNASAFSSYGSEKKGTPVKAFIRIVKGDEPIKVNCPVFSPDVLVIFHESCISNPNALVGIREDTIVIVNTDKDIQEIKNIIKAKNIAIVDANFIAFNLKARLNTIMLGALSKVVDFVPKEHVLKTIEDVLGKKYPALLELNIKSFNEGYDKTKIYRNLDVEIQKYEKKENPIGYMNQPIGGAIINPTNTIVKNFKASREGWIPYFNKEKCVSCGMCSLACPDMCFVWSDSDKPELLGIDYQYCKGCLRCIGQCPTGALTKVAERDVDINKISVDHHFKTKERIV